MAKQITQYKQPAGSIPQVIHSKGVDWKCISAAIDKDVFVFKGSNGKEYSCKWEDIPKTV